MDPIKSKVVTATFLASIGAWIAANLTQINLVLQAFAALFAIVVCLYTLRYRRKQIRALERQMQSESEDSGT